MSAFLRAKFLLVCPYGKRHLEKMVSDCKRDIGIVSIAAVCIIFCWNRMLVSVSEIYMLGSILLALYLVCMEVSNARMQKAENKVYRELLIYFSRVKHRYMASHHIANAVMEAADDMQYEIQRLAGELYQVLMESDRKEKIREYISLHRTNRYLKLFLIQAYEVSEKGDICFEENVEHLRLELMEELYRRKRRAYEFAGYVFVTAAPFFMMPLLKQWGMEFAPELEAFYENTGVLLEGITFGATIVIYGMILRAKEITFFTGNTEEKLWNLRGFYENCAVASLIQRLDRAEGNFSRSIRKLLLESEERISYGQFCLRILSSIIVSFLVLALTVGSAERLLLCIPISLCVGMLPVWKLFYQVQTIRSGAAYEVRQFQTIILMERKLQGITVIGLLEDMEVFSKCFHSSLRKCINSYGAGTKAALMRLKEEGGRLHEGFEELADAFLSVDEVGIELAFAEVESNRRMLEKMTQLEAEISLERKKDSTDILTKLPGTLAVGAYFILPFFIYSLQGVYEVFEILEEMSW